MRDFNRNVRKLPIRTLGLLLAVVGAASLRAGDFDGAPIKYSESTPNNVITQLAGKLKLGDKKLQYDETTGYLKDLLKELEISELSQTLVYSKTSFQRPRIAPDTPRALYFNEDCYIGYCRNGDVLEVSAVDSQLGVVFYTLEQHNDDRPKFVRQTDSCLICHGGSMTEGIPGNIVRSVYPSTNGEPIYSAGTTRVDHRTPLEKRWGGWYVSGTHGAQTHLGNLVVHTRQVPDKVDNSEGMNQIDLTKRFDPSAYLSPHSDLVALMILEHQCQGQNLIIKAGFETRQALHYEAALRNDFGEDQKAAHWDSTNHRIESACKSLVKYLLFHQEARLIAPLAGTTEYARQFAAGGIKDSQQRSLRDLDLQTRLFRFPLSYLIDSKLFQALPDDATRVIWHEIYSILTAEKPREGFEHLSPADRENILSIVRETVPNLPAEWKTGTSDKSPNQ